ncbi:MAG TPA: UDP-N-acetylmuramoyl-tripeptide--D-alanyl-D-alanine ligase [Streptosporangiaceae bacterium]|nr:UDP-N-acetylmuramoyl-tripeptide--D-alanyl-D-alanine ligase [Streptosporangiaceae bacterium]
MIPLGLAEIARVVDGTVYGAAGPGRTVTGPVVIDSREVTTGALFAAIAGARSDGHDFAAAAYAAGAIAVLGSRPVDGPCVVADDVVTALAKLAGFVRDRLSPVVIGLTGSVGKTTTKDLLAQILEGEAPTVATSRSFNNEIGLPLTILRVGRRTRYLVLEMGAAKPGDITHLVRVGRPRIGLVLNVGPAHVLTMGGIDGVAKTKGEMVRDLPAAAQGGVALLNADDERVAAMAGQTRAAVTFYGTGADAAVRARDVTLDAAGHASFTLHTPGAQAPVRLCLPGQHQVANALAAACAASAVGVPADRIADALSSAVPRSPGRFEIKERPDGVTVIDDAYNANPSSTQAAIRTLATMAAGRRTIAVIGEMMHQAEGTARQHEAIGTLAGALGLDVLVAVGQGEGPDAMAAAARGTGVSVYAVPDGDAAIGLLRGSLRHYDLVFSNSLIEHVGGHERRERFADTVHQLSGAYWVQTPYRYFPVEPHWHPARSFCPSRCAPKWSGAGRSPINTASPGKRRCGPRSRSSQT